MLTLQYHIAAEGPLWRPPDGSGLPVTTQRQDANEQLFAIGISSGYQAVSPLCPCRFAQGLHP